MTNEELEFILNAIEEIIENHKVWEQEYDYSSKTNEYYHKSANQKVNTVINELFEKL